MSVRTERGLSREFLKRCRPAARAWTVNTERATMSKLAKENKHAKAMLEGEANRAKSLLEEIDAMIGALPAERNET